MRERLSKIMSVYGIASRRHAEKLIADGQVKLNGILAVVGDKADPDFDLIEISGKQLDTKRPEKVYVMLNKPCGFVTTMSDEKGRRTVLNLITDLKTRVFPVGRLDVNSEGLLLMTNDGEMTSKLTHPSHNIDKEYELRVRDFSGEKLRKMAEPMQIDGYMIHPAAVRLLHKDGGGGILSVTIHEGRNRQIRKMCDLCGLEVVSLKRVSYAGLRLDNLLPGKWRPLTGDEIAYLKNL